MHQECHHYNQINSCPSHSALNNHSGSLLSAWQVWEVSWAFFCVLLISLCRWLGTVKLLLRISPGFLCYMSLFFMGLSTLSESNPTIGEMSLFSKLPSQIISCSIPFWVLSTHISKRLFIIALFLGLILLANKAWKCLFNSQIPTPVNKTVSTHLEHWATAGLFCK